jgi:hypothetical protein
VENKDWRYKVYSQEHGRLSGLQATNLSNQDNAFVQLSVGLFAILATFGKQIIVVNLALGILALIFLLLTIVQVVFGFFFSNRFLNAAKAKLSENYRDGERLDKGLGDIKTGKLVEVLNITTYISFGLAVTFLFILVVIYMSNN